MTDQKRMNSKPTTNQTINNGRWVNGIFCAKSIYFSSGGWENYKKEEVRTTAGNGGETKGDTEQITEERESREERADTSTKDQSKMERANTMEKKDSTDGEAGAEKCKEKSES